MLSCIVINIKSKNCKNLLTYNRGKRGDFCLTKLKYKSIISYKVNFY